MKAIALVVVRGGVAEAYAPEHVDVRVIDLDNIARGEDPEGLPRGVGFEALADEAGIIAGEDFYWGHRDATD
jgi:hypothetical protein